MDPVEFDAAAVRQALEECLLATCPEMPPNERAELVFHMTDWLSELENLCNLYLRPGTIPPTDAKKLLMKFLVHAPEHIAAAAEIFTGTGVTRVFGKRGGERTRRALR